MQASPYTHGPRSGAAEPSAGSGEGRYRSKSLVPARVSDVPERTPGPVRSAGTGDSKPPSPRCVTAPVPGPSRVSLRFLGDGSHGRPCLPYFRWTWAPSFRSGHDAGCGLGSRLSSTVQVGSHLPAGPSGWALDYRPPSGAGCTYAPQDRPGGLLVPRGGTGVLSRGPLRVGPGAGTPAVELWRGRRQTSGAPALVGRGGICSVVEGVQDGHGEDADGGPVLGPPLGRHSQNTGSWGGTGRWGRDEC